VLALRGDQRVEHVTPNQHMAGLFRPDDVADLRLQVARDGMLPALAKRDETRKDALQSHQLDPAEPSGEAPQRSPVLLRVRSRGLLQDIAVADHALLSARGDAAHGVVGGAEDLIAVACLFRRLLVVGQKQRVGLRRGQARTKSQPRQRVSRVLPSFLGRRDDAQERVQVPRADLPAIQTRAQHLARVDATLREALRGPARTRIHLLHSSRMALGGLRLAARSTRATTRVTSGLEIDKPDGDQLLTWAARTRLPGEAQRAGSTSSGECGGRVRR
jgi:hypothetical protein